MIPHMKIITIKPQSTHAQPLRPFHGWKCEGGGWVACDPDRDRAYARWLMKINQHEGINAVREMLNKMPKRRVAAIRDAWHQIVEERNALRKSWDTRPSAVVLNPLPGVPVMTNNPPRRWWQFWK